MLYLENFDLSILFSVLIDEDWTAKVVAIPYTCMCLYTTLNLIFVNRFVTLAVQSFTRGRLNKHSSALLAIWLQRYVQFALGFKAHPKALETVYVA